MYKVVGIKGAKEIERNLNQTIPSTIPIVIVIGPIKELSRKDKSLDEVLKIKKTLQKAAAGGLYVHLAPENQDLTGMYANKIHSVGTDGRRIVREKSEEASIIFNKGGRQEREVAISDKTLFGNNRFIGNYSVVKDDSPEISQIEFIYENLITIVDFKKEEIAFRTVSHINAKIDLPDLDIKNRIPVIGFLGLAGNYKTALINADIEKINLETIKELLLCIK